MMKNKWQPNFLLAFTSEEGMVKAVYTLTPSKKLDPGIPGLYFVKPFGNDKKNITSLSESFKVVNCFLLGGWRIVFSQIS